MSVRVDSNSSGGANGRNRRHKRKDQYNMTFSLMPSTLREPFLKDFPAYFEGMCKSKPGGFMVTPEFTKHAEEIYRFQPRSDDVFVMTFPKSGTTWMQDTVWLIMNDCDFQGAKKTLNIRSPFLEATYLLPRSLEHHYERDAIVRMTKLPMIKTVTDMLAHYGIWPKIQPIIRAVINLMVGNQLRDIPALNRMESPRVIKTHLPFYLLNPNLLDTAKVVYVARNPKDVIVSYYHYHRLMDFHRFAGNLETFADYFLKDQLWCSPFFPHLIQAWNRRHHPNMLFLFYEDLKKNLRGEVEKVAEFLGKPLSDEQLTRLTEHLRFDNFSKNAAVNNEFAKDLGIMKQEGHFIRKGKTGDWKNHFSPELNARIEQWMKKNLEGTDLRFITELDQQD